MMTEPQAAIIDALHGAAREAKRQEKEWLRSALKRKAYPQVFEFCTGRHPKQIKSIRDVFIYGHSEVLVDEAMVAWVWRYFERLTRLKS